MIGTIYILSDGLAFFPLLRGELLRHQPRLVVHHIQTREELAAIDRRDLAGARLVGFLTRVIVPAATLDATGFGAYNFHPGPPDFPGWRPVSFAVYQGVARFGVTAHAMAAAIDAGEIVGTVMFDVPPDCTETGLNNRMVLAVLRLFNLLAPDLATRLRPLTPLPLRWGQRRYTRAEATALCDIPPALDGREFDRRVRAFGAGPPDSRPRIHLHGRAFVMEAVAPDEVGAMPQDMQMTAAIGGR